MEDCARAEGFSTWTTPGFLALEGGGGGLAGWLATEAQDIFFPGPGGGACGEAPPGLSRPALGPPCSGGPGLWPPESPRSLGGAASCSRG